MSQPDRPAEGAHDRTLDTLRRRAVRTDLALGKVLDHLGLAAPTEDEVDAVINKR